MECSFQMNPNSKQCYLSFCQIYFLFNLNIDLKYSLNYYLTQKCYHCYYFNYQISCFNFELQAYLILVVGKSLKFVAPCLQYRLLLYTLMLFLLECYIYSLVVLLNNYQSLIQNFDYLCFLHHYLRTLEWGQIAFSKYNSRQNFQIIIVIIFTVQ